MARFPIPVLVADEVPISLDVVALLGHVAKFVDVAIDIDRFVYDAIVPLGSDVLRVAGENVEHLCPLNRSLRAA